MTKVEQAFELVIEILENQQKKGEAVQRAYEEFIESYAALDTSIKQLQAAFVEYHREVQHGRDQNHEEHERLRERLARLEKRPAG